MIPPFDPATGTLPPGIHEATLEEVATRFGTTPHRRMLLAGFTSALELLEVVGCRRVYLDGSFVSSKGVPGDYDACREGDGVDLEELQVRAPESFDLWERSRRLKARFRGELFPVDSASTQRDLFGRATFETFQRDKWTDALKGIVAITLGGRA